MLNGDPDEALLSDWHHLVPPGTVGERLGRELLARYGQPHRRYHDLVHLREVLDGVGLLGSYAVDLTAVRLAGWFHDAVYEARPGVDEEDSARLALRRLPGCGVPTGRVAEVARLVRLTAGHAPTDDDRNGAVLCDADLAILGSDPDRYDRYAAAVRAEYRRVPDPRYRAGRLATLRRLLARPRLYRTPEARCRWDDAARRNLTREIDRLRDPSVPLP